MAHFPLFRFGFRTQQYWRTALFFALLFIAYFYQVQLAVIGDDE